MLFVRAMPRETGVRAQVKFQPATLIAALPAITAIVALLALAWWLNQPAAISLSRRIPGTDAAPAAESSTSNPILAGKVIHGDGQSAALPGAWPGFRGGAFAGVAVATTGLARTWDSAGPKQLWSVDLGEGYAGAAVQNGRVYVMDYDQAKKQDALRCLSLADGKEIWRFVYANPVKRNHGMSRTIPALTEKFAVVMGPKCHVACVDARSGELRWGIDLAREFGTTVPPWYAGQNPLVDGDKVILAPGGSNALLIAVSIETGKLVWQTPNPKAWQMTHSSVVPMSFAGKREYIYCASHGVVGVSAEDGTLLWETTEWKISIATIPSPVVLEGGKIFFTGGYNAGSLMLQLAQDGDRTVPKVLFRLGPEIFGATQHTPVFHNGHLFGVRADGQLVCLDLTGKVVWSSGLAHQFGLGPFLIVGDLLYAMDDSGKLSLFEASTDKFHLLSEAKVLHGRESWGPLALADRRLLARDFTKMVCLDVGAGGNHQ
jgi:outer membrane protein assembly factor BamB